MLNPRHKYEGRASAQAGKDPLRRDFLALGLSALLNGLCLSCQTDRASSLLVLTVDSQPNIQDLTVQSFRSGLPPSDRHRVRTDSTRRTISVDLSRESKSPVTVLLSRIANRHKTPIVVSLKRPWESFCSLVSRQTPRGVELVPFEKVFHVGNYVSARDGVLGQTLVPLESTLEPDTLYSCSPQFEIYVATDIDDVVEISATIFHELAHVVFGPGHPPSILAVEDEARKNSKQESWPTECGTGFRYLRSIGRGGNRCGA